MIKIKINPKKIKIIFIKIKSFLIGKPLFSVFLFFLLSTLIALLIFYNYIFILPQKNISINWDAFIVNRNQYNNIFSKLNERMEKLEKKEEYDLFSPIIKNDKEAIRKDYFNETEENQNIMEEELESILIQTLFDFYEINKNEMPPISERALIWEKLGLGSVEEYKGNYNQNINLLRALKEEIEKEID